MHSSVISHSAFYGDRNLSPVHKHGSLYDEKFLNSLLNSNKVGRFITSMGKLLHSYPHFTKA